MLEIKSLRFKYRELAFKFRCQLTKKLKKMVKLKIIFLDILFREIHCIIGKSNHNQELNIIHRRITHNSYFMEIKKNEFKFCLRRQYPLRLVDPSCLLEAGPSRVWQWPCSLRGCHSPEKRLPPSHL